jgi:hypothetical protein
MRGGKLNSSVFFERHEGHGSYAEMLEQLFRTSKRKAGFLESAEKPPRMTFQRPIPQQVSLF